MNNLTKILLKSCETIFICPMTCSRLQETLQKNFDSSKNKIWCIEGNRCTTVTRIFCEFYSKLPFPCDHKRDWDIFYEYIQDIVDYYYGEGINHFFIVDHAIALKNLSEKDCNCFLSMLAGIENDWLYFQKKKRFCKTILCCQPRQEHILMDILASAKLSYITIDTNLSGDGVLVNEL